MLGNTASSPLIPEGSDTETLPLRPATAAVNNATYRMQLPADNGWSFCCQGFFRILGSAAVIATIGSVVFAGLGGNEEQRKVGHIGLAIGMSALVFSVVGHCCAKKAEEEDKVFHGTKEEMDALRKRWCENNGIHEGP